MHLVTDSHDSRVVCFAWVLHLFPYGGGGGGERGARASDGHRAGSVQVGRDTARVPPRARARHARRNHALVTHVVRSTI